MAFRDNLKSELTYQDIRVKELAEKTSISKKTLDNYLAKNNCNPSAENAVKIAQALGVSVEWLVTGKKSNEQHEMRNEVAELLRIINYLNDRDLLLLKSIAERLEERL